MRLRTERARVCVVVAQHERANDLRARRARPYVRRRERREREGCAFTVYRDGAARVWLCERSAPR
jgi:hypothetical protein